MRSAPTLKIWMTPFSSVAMLEKYALFKMASCSACVLIFSPFIPWGDFIEGSSGGCGRRQRTSRGPGTRRHTFEGSGSEAPGGLSGSEGQCTLSTGKPSLLKVGDARLHDGCPTM